MPYLRWEITHHSRIKWFDGQGDHPVTAKALGYYRPSGWDKTVEAVLAHHVSTHLALGRAASQLHGRAASAMAAHRDTGAAHVGREKHDLDWIVFLEDGGGTKKSALSIEFGHLTRGGKGRVGGLYILTGAANHMAKTRKKRWDK